MQYLEKFNIFSKKKRKICGEGIDQLKVLSLRLWGTHLKIETINVYLMRVLKENE
jgi:hypothetical protein